MTAIQAIGLSKRYRRSWALRDCTLAIPSGHVVALVGPNGAGKTTLLNLAAGLLRPTAGGITVLDGRPAGSDAARAGLAFVAQDAPLYPHLTVDGMLRVAGGLNATWDGPRAAARIADLHIPADRKVRALSGGQRAQLALTIALAKRPRLLILDEPMASLDPLARHEFLGALMAAVAQDGLSVIFSSHVVSELERIADYLVVLNGGRVQVAGEVDRLLATHTVLTGPGGEMAVQAPGSGVVEVGGTGTQTRLLMRTRGDGAVAAPGWQADRPSVEEIVLAYLRNPSSSTLPGPELLPVGRPAVTS
jgi:ABC-2 type transport system ATP-binding protein